MKKELKLNLNEFKNICAEYNIRIPSLCRYYVKDKPVFYLTALVKGQRIATKNYKDFDKINKWASKNFISYDYY